MNYRGTTFWHTAIYKIGISKVWDAALILIEETDVSAVGDWNGIGEILWEFPHKSHWDLWLVVILVILCWICWCFGEKIKKTITSHQCLRLQPWIPTVCGMRRMAADYHCMWGGISEFIRSSSTALFVLIDYHRLVDLHILWMVAKSCITKRMVETL